MSKQIPEVAEQEFFTALVEADKTALDRLLADDFVLIDVLTGSEVPKSALLEAVEDGLQFEEINQIDFDTRVYGSVAIITGQTKMSGSFNGPRFELNSRYTHVFVAQGNGWRLVSAQGTQISAPPAGPTLQGDEVRN